MEVARKAAVVLHLELLHLADLAYSAGEECLGEGEEAFLQVFLEQGVVEVVLLGYPP